MKILVTGATGFTGRQLVPLLREKGHVVVCLVRGSSDRSAVTQPGVLFVEGQIDDPASIVAGLRGTDVLINIVGLARGNEEVATRTQGIIQACNQAGVRRAIFISSTGIFTTMEAGAKKAKILAEEAIETSALDYTILRPTMIYGPGNDRNMIRLIRILRRWPVILVPGRGNHLLQPIHVNDLAQAIVDCLEQRMTIRKSYNLSGAVPMTFNEVISLTSQALGVRRLVIHLPLWPVVWAARMLNRIKKRSWIKEERILRLNENKCFDYSAAARDFGFAPRSFGEGIRQEVLIESGTYAK